jgi:hypothetical protein
MFQRIFGRAEEARGAESSLGPPLSAISRSNWNWIAVNAVQQSSLKKNGNKKL